jgi:hypothetical protein
LSWSFDPSVTALARQVFPQSADLKAEQDGSQCVIRQTPYGVLELLPIEEGYLIAAQSPPVPPCNLESDPRIRGYPRIRRHLKENGLKLWKLVPTRQLETAIRALAGADEEDAPGPEHSALGGPYVAPLSARPELCG